MMHSAFLTVSPSRLLVFGLVTRRKVVASKVLAINNELGRRREVATDAAQFSGCASASALMCGGAAKALCASGFAVVRGALREQDASALARDMSALADSGALSATVQAKMNTRQDDIGWLDEREAASKGLRALSGAIRLLKAVAAEAVATGAASAAGAAALAVPQRAMVACYPPGGAAYVPHMDCSVKDGKPTNRRVLTCCLYANERWDAREDGGCLRLLIGGKGGAIEDALEVAPEAGTLVIFRSREMLHEVLATRGRRRLAITLWLFDTLSPSNIA